MIIYQIALAIVMIGTLNNCVSFDGKLIGFCIWGILAIIPLFTRRAKMKMTEEQKLRDINYFKYQEKYFNDYGEMP